jgi:hypothetical protein
MLQTPLAGAEAAVGVRIAVEQCSADLLPHHLLQPVALLARDLVLVFFQV